VCFSLFLVVSRATENPPRHFKNEKKMKNYVGCRFCFSLLPWWIFGRTRNNEKQRETHEKQNRQTTCFFIFFQ